MICHCCKKDSKKVRPVFGYILCNECHLGFINFLNKSNAVVNNNLEIINFLNKSDVVVNNNEKKEVCKSSVVVTEYEEKDTWFDRCRRARLNSAMDNQPLSDIFY